MNRICFSILAVLCLSLFALAIQSRATFAAGTLPRETAVLRWLDKTAGRVRTIEATVNQTFHVQGLQIIVRACVERAPEDPPESAVFLDVWETRAGHPAEEVYRGWMYASSPGVSAMEHPVYDVWVLDCK